MGELHKKVLDYRLDGSRMEQLAKSCGISDAEKASSAYELAVPAVIQGMINTSATRPGMSSLMKSAGGLSWVERSEPDTLFTKSDHRIGIDVIDKIFGQARQDVYARLASRTDISEVSSKALLEITGLITIANLSSVSRDEFTEEFFTDAIGKEEGGPSETTGAWAIEDSSDDAAAASSASGSDRDHDSGSANATAGALDATDSEENPKKAWMFAGGIAAVLILGIIASQAFGGGGGTTEAESADELAIVDDGSDSNGDGDPTDETDDPTDAASENVQPVPVNNADSDIVSISVPMLDITGTTPEASGVLSFDLNQVTGEVCYSIESDLVEGPYRSHIHVGTADEKGGIVVDLGPNENGDTGCVDNLPVDTKAILANRAGHYAELHDLSEEWTIRGQLSDTIDGDIVSISVPMLDITGTTPEASGVLSFDLNQVTGEVCYSIESDLVEGPYRSHIHVGTADEKGGIVVDLGPNENGDTGCVDNLPVDTKAILANRAGHYAELHDLSEEWTIRGQLSDTIEEASADSSGDVVDTDGGGARTVLDGGTIYLEGDVPDQATADELVTSLVRVGSATPIVDNLNVVDGAPLPSGRIVIADAVFFNVNSDEVKAIDEDTLAAITALAQSRPDWILTVVGHTDGSGSDVYNLELSLRRATALRDLLAEQGIPDENLRLRGAGETAPIGDNDTEAGRAQNRRIEFEFTPGS